MHYGQDDAVTKIDLIGLIKVDDVLIIASYSP